MCLCKMACMGALSVLRYPLAAILPFSTGRLLILCAGGCNVDSHSFM